MRKSEWENWWLAATPRWGAVKLRQLAESVGDGRTVLAAMKSAGDATAFYERIRNGWECSSAAVWGESLKITPQDVKWLWEHQKEQLRCQADFCRWTERGIHFVTIWDASYPQQLKTIYDPPFALYVRGTLPDPQRPSAAVIGARACSGYGITQGRRLARELAAEGVQIISGLAYGVDSEGHWGALESGVAGATYAILGCGVEQCYPPEHEKLAGRILENGGGLLSEFPPGTAPSPKHFPMRNRIISGLSDCILVIEARKRSGSLITVDQALEQGREVFALPGRVGDGLSEGCHQLIRNGANILTGSGDVLEFLFPERVSGGDEPPHPSSGTLPGRSPAAPASPSAMAPGENPPEKHLVYSALDCVGKTVEEIMGLTGLPLQTVRMQLLELLLEDQIVETVKGYYSVEL